MPVPTAASREQDLKNVATKFSEYLCEVPGTQLPASLRLGIAICARDALVNCPGCREHLQSKACLKPKVVCSYKDIVHSPDFPAPTGCTTTRGSASNQQQQHECLRSIVHSLISVQSSLNDKWYDDTIQAMMNCNLLPQDKKVAQYHSALIEIILVAIMSNSLHTAFLVLMIEPFPLPTFEDIRFAPAPHCLDLEQMLKPGRSLRQWDWISHAPFILHQDINSKSPEFTKKVSPMARQSVPSEYVFLPFLPFVTINLAYEDAHMLTQIVDVVDVLYVPVLEIIMAFRHLNPSKKCTSSVTRFDLEVVAEAVASSYDCAY